MCSLGTLLLILQVNREKFLRKNYLAYVRRLVFQKMAFFHVSTIGRSRPQ